MTYLKKAHYNKPLQYGLWKSASKVIWLEANDPIFQANELNWFDDTDERNDPYLKSIQMV